MNSFTLISKLEAHLKHVQDMMKDKTFRVLSPEEKIEVVLDEIVLMLGLIDGAKED